MNMIANQILLHNMYDMGAIKKETMAEFKTKDIIIKLERKVFQIGNSIKTEVIKSFRKKGKRWEVIL